MVLPAIHERFTEAELEIIMSKIADELLNLGDKQFCYNELPAIFYQDEDFDFRNDCPDLVREWTDITTIPCENPKFLITIKARIPNFETNLSKTDSRVKYGFRTKINRMANELKVWLEHDNFRNRWTIEKYGGWRYNIIFGAQNKDGDIFNVEWELEVTD